MKKIKLFTLALTSFFGFIVLAQSLPPEISEIRCDPPKKCSQGFECFNFPEVGLRCAKPNPCSYYKCPEKTFCAIAEIPPLICSPLEPVLETKEAEKVIGLEEEISAKDLEVSEPKILPGDSFYFLKNWLREIRLFFSFNYVERVELRTKIANEKLIELKKMITDKKKPEEVKKTIENYQKEIERIKKEAEKIKEKGNENPKLAAFLDKFLHQQLLHQKLLQKLENQVSPEVVEKIRKVREKNLEKFQEVILKLENRKEKISNLEIFLKKLKGVPCGCWHMLGSVVCECRGKLEKFICPSGAVCDEGIDTCYGECGNCKCYNSSNQEVSCNGLEKFFKESVSHSMPTNPSEPVEKIYCISLWNPVCGKDGKTYSNECYAKLAGVEIAYKGECNKEDRIEGIIKECRWTMKDQCERMIGKCYSIEIPENGEKILCTDKEKRKILEKFLNKNVVLKEIENPKSSLKMCPCYLEYQKIEEKK